MDTDEKARYLLTLTDADLPAVNRKWGNLWRCRAMEWFRQLQISNRVVMRQAGQIFRLKSRIAAQQAKIDALMMEHCPEEMTERQTATWAKHQRVSAE